MHALLHVISACVHTDAAARDAVRLLRRAAGIQPDDVRTLLLVCDLPDSESLQDPRDDAIIRTLQSGVMAMNPPDCRRYLLLIRRREWDDASRLYLGRRQRTDVRRIICDLLAHGETVHRFAAATFSPAFLKGRFSAVLFSDLSLTCTPDTPLRMMNALTASSCGALGAAVIPHRGYPCSALARLGHFTLSSAKAMRWESLRLRSLTLPDSPVIYTPETLLTSQLCPNAPVPVAENCFFVPLHPPRLAACFAAFREDVRRTASWNAFLPPAQLALLFFSAWTGAVWPAGCAVLIAESFALLHPRMLPDALLRIALLPVTASLSLDALLMRALSGRWFCVRCPAWMHAPAGCVLLGALLLLFALRSAHALAALLPVSLLWLSAPLLFPALDAPASERIPLDAAQMAHMHALAESEFARLSSDAASPCAVLAACAACMLRLLEPDEAARRIQAQLESGIHIGSASDAAALLASAQYLREHMGDCDAALRDLPARIEQIVLSAAIPCSTGRLHALLCAAGLRQADAPSAGSEIDVLFLPLTSARNAKRQPETLPLTHPHTFLQREPQSDPKTEESDSPERFLAISAAVLGHPFYPLLLRSPVTGPYAALFLS